MKLYQFQISHYCEKVRWALDYKNIAYQKITLTPGLHLFTTQKIAPKSSVPILVDRNQVIQNSSEIITYLDGWYPEKSLTPSSSEECKESLVWEKYCDNEIGVHLRRYFYGFLLSHKKIVAPMLSEGVSFVHKKIFWLMFPKVRQVMRKRMNITPETAMESKEKLQLAIDKVSQHLQNREFMVGNSFSRADIAVAALMAPMFEPIKYGLNWPKSVPDELDLFRKENQEKIQKIIQIYQNYR